MWPKIQHSNSGNIVKLNYIYKLNGKGMVGGKLFSVWRHDSTENLNHMKQMTSVSNQNEATASLL